MTDFTAEQAKENLTEYAMKHICKMLREDPAYRYSWQANIAMAFMDELDDKVRTGEYGRYPMNRAVIHKYANDAADRFLNLLARDHVTADDVLKIVALDKMPVDCVAMASKDGLEVIIKNIGTDQKTPIEK